LSCPAVYELHALSILEQKGSYDGIRRLYNIETVISNPIVR